MEPQDEKDKRNYTGQTPSDVPSEKLVEGPPKDRPKKAEKRPGHNSTGKDPNLGGREPVLR